MNTQTTQRRTRIVVGLLGGLTALPVGGPLVMSALAGPRGPVVAIDKAHEAAERASIRTQAIDRDANAVMGEVRAREVADVTRRGAGSAIAKRGDGDPAEVDAGRQQLASLPPDMAKTTLYDPVRHRDPFRPPSIGANSAGASSRTPLERYDLGQLKLVGVVWEEGAASAMVEDSAGKGYIVSTGTLIGSSGGVVRSVEPRRILIEENITNFYGEKEPREVVMKLPEEDRSP